MKNEKESSLANINTDDLSPMIKKKNIKIVYCFTD